MTYSVNAVANYFISAAQKSGTNINLMRLQEFMYYAQGWHLAVTESPAFNEYIEAWEYGPVITSLYYPLRHLGLENIVDPLVTKDYLTKASYIESVPRKDQNTLDILDRVYQMYNQYPTVQLANMSHNQDGPWAITLHNAGPILHKQIDHELMMDYFLGMAHIARRKHGPSEPC